MTEHPKAHEDFEDHPDYEPEPDFFDEEEEPGQEDAAPAPAEGDDT